MRSLLLVSLLYLLALGTYSAPVEEKVEPSPAVAASPSTLIESVPPAPVVEEEPKEPQSSSIVPTEVPDEESEEESPTTALPTDDEEKSEKKGRQLDEDEEDGDDEGQDDNDDDDEEDDADEDEEEDERKTKGESKGGPTKSVAPGKKKPVVPGKPVPVLGEGVEDDEAEDLGIFEREEPKSNESSSPKASDEEKSDEEKDDESNEDEERDEPIGGPSGLVVEPSSSERADEVPVVATAVQNEVSPSEQLPLGVAVVQPEEGSDPVVPIIVEENSPAVQSSQAQEKTQAPSRKVQKPKPIPQDDDDDDDDEDDDDEDDDDGRSTKLHHRRHRAAYNPSPVLYYYPFPEATSNQ